MGHRQAGEGFGEGFLVQGMVWHWRILKQVHFLKKFPRLKQFLEIFWADLHGGAGQGSHSEEILEGVGSCLQKTCHCMALPVNIRDIDDVTIENTELGLES